MTLHRNSLCTFPPFPFPPGATRRPEMFQGCLHATRRHTSRENNWYEPFALLVRYTDMSLKIKGTELMTIGRQLNRFVAQKKI